MSSRGTERHHSLRRRLLALVLAAIALASLLQAVSAYRSALAAADALLDAQLQALAHSYQAGRGAPPSWDMAVRVWGPDGVLLFDSGTVRLPSQPMIGFSEMQAGGDRWRVYNFRAADRTVQIAQNLDVRRQRARAMALDAVLPIALLGLALMVAVWAVIAHSLQPVERVRRQVAQRPAEDLSPLPEAGLPTEVLPLVRDLNLLFDRVREAFRSQQQFVADAAHELRSPLTALKLQAQALHRPLDEAARAQALARLEDGIGRAIALVTQLLALAREEAVEPGEARQFGLQDLCREAVSEVLPLALARRIDLGLADDAAEVAVRGDREGLRTLLRNLLENAVKFTPEDGRVDLELAREDGAALLAVEDSGPGIPAHERERVFDRFYRTGATDAPGSGLGLAIVAAIARRHGATVAMAEPRRLGGARVEVRFPGTT